MSERMTTHPTPPERELVALLACPFCGGDAHLERQGHVCCMTPGCRGFGAFDNFGTPSEQNASAITRWNTRAATVPQGVSDDSARLNYVLRKVFFDRYGACLPCGGTKIDQDMIAESIKNIDAATTPPPAELGEGS